MPFDPSVVGKKYGPSTYEVGAEKLREFAYAISGGVPSMGFSGTGAPSGLNPLLHDQKAGEASHYASIIAAPSFANVFAIAPFGQAVADPALGINLLMLVHGEQEFEFFSPVKPGDVITTVGEITKAFDKQGKDFLVVSTESKNQRGELVVKGTWTAVIRQG
jgi:acyl dehydratase